MQIGIDANPANREQRTGTEWYAFNLIQALKKQLLEVDERVILYSAQPLRDDLKELPANWESRVLHWPFKRFWTQGRFSWEMLRRPVDVLFVPAHAIPRIHPHSKKKQRATVTTIHDLAFRRLPGLYEPKKRRYLNWSTRFATRHAAALLVPSEATKQDVMEFYRVPTNRIAVTPLAPDHARFDRVTEGDVERVRKAYQLSPSYFLTVSRLEEKKNIVNLIRAFELFKSRRGVGDPFELVLVGKPGHGYEKIKSFLNASSAKGQIKELGWVKEEEVPALMKGAFTYVYPSWYEGFGISAVEAMAAGTALIASDLPVMHEVAGDAAWYARPNEPEAFASLFARLVDEPTSREQMVAAGKMRVKDFQWEETARKTLEVLRECDIPENILHNL